MAAIKPAAITKIREGYKEAEPFAERTVRLGTNRLGNTKPNLCK